MTTPLLYDRFYRGKYDGTYPFEVGNVRSPSRDLLRTVLDSWNACGLDTDGKAVFSYRESPVGGYFENETGWWMVDSVSYDPITGGEAWLIGRDGEEWQVSLRALPELKYL